ncbi:MAG: DnaJ domain-containing protein [Sandaracinaceae bacterium]
MSAQPQLPEPIAQGNLAKTPFAHVMLYIQQRGLAGTLVLWQQVPSKKRPVQDRIAFLEGQPVAARLSRPASRLDRSLLPIFARQVGPYAFYEGVDLVGDHPSVRRGNVDPMELLAASLRGSCRDDAVEAVLARFGDRPVRLVPGVDLDRFQLLPPEQAFVELIRAEPATIAELSEASELPGKMAERVLYLLTITRSLAAFEGDPTAATSSMPTLPPAGSEMRGLLRSLPVPPGAPGSSEDLPSLDPSDGAPTDAPTATVPTAVTSAAVTSEPASPSSDPWLRHVPERPDSKGPDGPGSSPRMSSVSGTHPAPGDAQPGSPEARPSLAAQGPQPVPPPPEGLSDGHRKYWHDVARRFESLDSQTYFQMLGLSIRASEEDARKAYLQLVKRWHPDRVPPELVGLRPYVEAIFRYLTEAQEHLTNGAKRAAYVQAVESGGGTPASDRRLNRIVQAAMEFRKVEVLIRRREWTKASHLLEEVLLLNENEPDYHAAQGWVLFQMKGTEPAVRPIILASLQRAIELNDRNDRAHFYLGTYLKQMGEEARALAHFEKAARLNSKNIDAQREVRLARMRGLKGKGRRSSSDPGKSRRPSKPSKNDGFLSRLFGGGGSDKKR